MKMKILMLDDLIGLAAPRMENVTRKTPPQRSEKALSCDRWYLSETEEAALRASASHPNDFGVASGSTADCSDWWSIQKMRCPNEIIVRRKTRLGKNFESLG
jgi:hypothetical protein